MRGVQESAEINVRGYGVRGAIHIYNLKNSHRCLFNYYCLKKNIIKEKSAYIYLHLSTTVMFKKNKRMMREHFNTVVSRMAKLAFSTQTLRLRISRRIM